MDLVGRVQRVRGRAAIVVEIHANPRWATVLRGHACRRAYPFRKSQGKQGDIGDFEISVALTTLIYKDDRVGRFWRGKYLQIARLPYTLGHHPSARYRDWSWAGSEGEGDMGQ